MSIKATFLNLKDSLESNIARHPYYWMVGTFIIGVLIVSTIR